MVRKVIKKPEIKDVPTLVDTIGDVKTQLKVLGKTEDKLVAQLKTLGLGARHGTRYDANVFTRSGAPTVNWEGAVTEAKVSKSLIAKHSRTVVVVDWATIALEAQVDIKTVAKHTTPGKDVVVCTVTARTQTVAIGPGAV